MTLAETLQQKLSDWRPTESGRQTWTDPTTVPGWTIHLVADRVDSLGCLLWDLTLTAKEKPWTSATALRTAADALTLRARGLLEPLRVIEVDDLRMEAMIRSDAPAHRGQKIRYYEMRLVGPEHKLTLRRYETEPQVTNKREQIAFALTHEVIAGLLEDLASR